MKLICSENYMEVGVNDDNITAFIEIGGTKIINSKLQVLGYFENLVDALDMVKEKGYNLFPWTSWIGYEEDCYGNGYYVD